MESPKRALRPLYKAAKRSYIQIKTTLGKAIALFQPQIPLQSKRFIYLNIVPPASLFDTSGSFRILYPGNEIHTNKYSLLTFIPKNFYEQFRRLANFYFLALVVLQFFPVFAVANPFYAALPITFIIVVTALKDGYEDLKRYQSDRSINSTLCQRLEPHLNFNLTQVRLSIFGKCFRSFRRFFVVIGKVCRGRLEPRLYFDELSQAGPSVQQQPLPQSVASLQSIAMSEGQWRDVEWQDVQVGDIVMLKNNQPVPADLIVLSTSEPDGLCYIETKNLDGETNLKIRNAHAATAWIKAPADIARARLRIEAEPPNTNLYSFNGALYLMDGADSSKAVPVSINELLLRGCVIRNTAWLIGVVAFTGRQTKLILNSGETPSKRSMIEKQMNPQVRLSTRLRYGLIVLYCRSWQILF